MHAGAVRAIELDINPEWPTLVTYGRGGVGPTKVVPNYQQSATAISCRTTATSSPSTGGCREPSLFRSNRQRMNPDGTSA